MSVMSVTVLKCKLIREDHRSCSKYFRRPSKSNATLNAMDVLINSSKANSVIECHVAYTLYRVWLSAEYSAIPQPFEQSSFD